MGIFALAQTLVNALDPSLAARKKPDAIAHHIPRALWPYDRGIDAPVFR
jgi:hypothetical protein